MLDLFRKRDYTQTAIASGLKSQKKELRPWMFAMLMDNTITTDVSALVTVKARVLKEVPGWDMLV